jgi:hypothetical protein
MDWLSALFGQGMGFGAPGGIPDTTGGAVPGSAPPVATSPTPTVGASLIGPPEPYGPPAPAPTPMPTPAEAGPGTPGTPWGPAPGMPMSLTPESVTAGAGALNGQQNPNLAATMNRLQTAMRGVSAPPRPDVVKPSTPHAPQIARVQGGSLQDLLSTLYRPQALPPQTLGQNLGTGRY